VTDETDASVSDACIFILLQLGGALTNGRWRCHGERLFGIARFTVGGWQINHLPLVEIAAQMSKRAGKLTWRPERVVSVMCCGGAAGDAMSRAASTSGLKMLFPRSVPLRM
jgi:hypothetical protein